MSASLGEIHLRNVSYRKNTAKFMYKVGDYAFFQNIFLGFISSFLFLHPFHFLRLFLLLKAKGQVKLRINLKAARHRIYGQLQNYFFLPTFELLSCVYKMTSQAPN